MAGSADYRFIATLVRPETTTDPDCGSPIESWIDVAPWHIAVDSLTAREQLVADQIDKGVTRKVRGRYRTDVQSTWRIRYTDPRGPKLLAIIGIDDTDPRRMELKLDCSELANAC